MLLSKVLTWSARDIFNEDLLRGELQPIPEKFENASDWVEKFRPYVLEEVHASLLKKLSSNSYFEANFTINYISISKELSTSTFLHGSIDSESLLRLNMNDTKPDTEEEETDTNDLSESTAMSFLGIYCLKTASTNRTCINESSKIIVAKVTVFKDKERQHGNDKKDEDNCSILVNGQLWQEEIEAYGDSRHWSLFFLPSCLISPSINIDRALNEVSLLQENESILIEQMMQGVFTEGELDLPRMNPLLRTSGSLNEHQDKAVQKVLHKMTSPRNSLSSIQLIHGPPGTGKSSTLVSIIRGLLTNKRNVLVTAPTNFAVCELAGRSIRNLPLDFPMHQIVLHGSKTRLKLDNELEKIHLSSRISRLIKAIRRWEGHRRSILRSPDETTQLVLDECINDLTVIFLDCPASLLSDRERRSVKNCLDCLTQTRSRELISDLKPLEENFYYVLFHVSISAEVFDTLKAEILFSATLIFSTVSMAASLRFFWLPLHLYKKRQCFLDAFQCIVVDEATQLLEPATSILLTNQLRCLVLAGDHKQLPATVLSKYGYRKSLFDRLIQSEFPSSMLKVQYRMHPAISYWPSKTFYNSLIVDGSNVLSPSYDKSWYNEFPPLSAYDVDGVEQTDEASSKYNIHEALLVIKIIRSLDDRIGQSKKATDDEAIKVGIISPYAAQVRAINAELNSHVFRSFSSVECSSVDAFQGKECDVIILSTVRSSIDLGFLQDMRRFNVAITRAKYSLILVGNCDALSRHPKLRDFLSQVRSLKTFHHRTSRLVSLSRDAAQRQIAQTKELWDGTHQLFEKCKWKICFTNEFKASVVKASSSLKEEIMKSLLRLGHGKWPRYEQPLIEKIENSLIEVIFVYPFSTFYLIWRVDVKKEILSNKDIRVTQMIKIINLISPNEAERYLTRLCSEVAVQNEEIIGFCKERGVQNQLIYPISRSSDLLNRPKAVSVAKIAALVKEEGTEYLSSVEKVYSLNSFVASFLLKASVNDSLQLPHDVSPEESELVNEEGPHFVLGRSGTGKTTVMLYRLVKNERAFRAAVDDGTFQADDFRQVLMTASPVLASAIEDSYYRLINSGTPSEMLKSSGELTGTQLNSSLKRLDLHMKERKGPLITTFHQLLKMIDLCLDKPFQSTQSGKYGQLIDFNCFTYFYFPRLGDVTQGGRFAVDAAGLYKEIISVIKGSMAAVKEGNSGAMSRQSYIALSEKRVSGLSADERENLYSLFEVYEGLKARSETYDYDMADFVSYVYSRLSIRSASKAFPLAASCQAVFVDEVQDLTMLQLAILRFLCSDWKAFFFAGDTAQTIAQGVGFRFEALKDLFYEEFLPNFGKDSTKRVPEIKQLKQNFRTHYQILQLANTVIRLLMFYFPDSMDPVDDEMSLQIGPKPIFLEDTEDVVSIMFQRGEMGQNNCEFGSEQVILVHDVRTKEEVKKICGTNALVLTVYECKGMEFSDVLIYNFFSSSTLNNHWRVIYGSFEKLFQIEDDVKYPKFDEKLHFPLCQELKMLYVLITRAKQRVIFFERDKTIRKVLIDLWTNEKVNVIVVKPFDEGLKQILTVKSSPEEWCQRGHEFLNRQNYEDARLCFQRGGDRYHERLCYAKLLVQSATASEVSNPVKALTTFCQAAEVYEEPPLEKLLEAAELYKRGKEHVKAGELFAKERRWVHAAECYECVKKWSLAAENFLLGGEVKRAIDSYVTIPNYFKAVETVEKEIEREETTETKECSENYQQLLTTLIKKGADYHCSKAEETNVLSFVRKMKGIEEQRKYLSRRNLFSAMIMVELEAGNFQHVASIYEQQGKYRDTIDVWKKAGVESQLEVVRIELKLFRLKNISEDLIFHPQDPKKTKTTLIKFLQDFSSLKGTDLEFEIKFWANFDDYFSGTFREQVENCKKTKNAYPQSLNVRLAWFRFRKVLSYPDLQTDKVSWLLVKDIVVLFYDSVLVKILSVLGRSLSLTDSKLSETENIVYSQILDMFGLRLTSSSAMFSVDHGKFGENTLKLWNSLELSPSKTETHLSLQHKEALRAIQKWVKRLSVQNDEILYAKAKSTWEARKSHVLPRSKYSKFIIEMNTNKKGAASVSEAEKIQLLLFLATTQNTKVSKDSDKLREQCMNLLISEVFFPLCYIFEDIQFLLNTVGSNYELLDVIHARVTSSLSVPYDYESILINCFFMEYLPDERSNLLLEGYLQMRRPQSLYLLLLGLRLQVSYCLSNQTTKTMINEFLVPSQSKISRFLTSDWNDKDSPLFYRRGMLSPFTYLKLLEQTLVISLFIRSAAENDSVLLTVNLMKEVMLRSPRMKKMFNILVQAFRTERSVLKKKTKEELNAHIRGLTGNLLAILNAEKKDIEKWFTESAIGRTGRYAECNSNEVISCFYMRAIHLLFLSHYNTTEFSNKIKEWIENKFKKLELKLPEHYNKFLGQHVYNKNLVLFVDLCHTFEDPLIELRIDSWRKEVNCGSAKIVRRILQPSDALDSSPLLLITKEEYDQWEEEQAAQSLLQSTSNVRLVNHSANDLSNTVSANAVETADIDMGAGLENVEETEKEVVFQSLFKRSIRYKILDWIDRARKTIAKLNPFTRFQREIEKKFLSYGLFRSKAVVVFYCQHLIHSYFDLLNEGMEKKEELSRLLSSRMKDIVDFKDVDEIHEHIDEKYPKLLEMLQPEQIIKDFTEFLNLSYTKRSDIDDESAVQIDEQQVILEEKMLNRKEIVKADYKALCEILNEIQQHLKHVPPPSSTSSTANIKGKKK